MSKEAFTPGPWVAHEGMYAFGIKGDIFARDTGKTIYEAQQICRVTPSLSYNERKAKPSPVDELQALSENRREAEIINANAHLIAAAPELYEALSPLEEFADQMAADAPEWNDSDTVRIVIPIGDLRSAVAALKRARGEA